MNKTEENNHQPQAKDPQLPRKTPDADGENFEEAVIAITDYVDASHTYPFTTW